MYLICGYRRLRSDLILHHLIFIKHVGSYVTPGRASDSPTKGPIQWRRLWGSLTLPFVLWAAGTDSVVICHSDPIYLMPAQGPKDCCNHVSALGVTGNCHHGFFRILKSLSMLGPAASLVARLALAQHFVCADEARMWLGRTDAIRLRMNMSHDNVT